MGSCRLAMITIHDVYSILLALVLMVATAYAVSQPYHSTIIHPQVINMTRDFDLCEGVSQFGGIKGPGVSQVVERHCVPCDSDRLGGDHNAPAFTQCVFLLAR